MPTGQTMLYFLTGNGERVPAGACQEIDIDVAGLTDCGWLFEPMEMSFTAKATVSTRWALFTNYAWPKFFKRDRKLFGRWVK